MELVPYWSTRPDWTPCNSLENTYTYTGDKQLKELWSNKLVRKAWFGRAFDNPVVNQPTLFSDQVQLYSIITPGEVAHHMQLSF